MSLLLSFTGKHLDILFWILSLDGFVDRKRIISEARKLSTGVSPGGVWPLTRSLPCSACRPAGEVRGRPDRRHLAGGGEGAGQHWPPARRTVLSSLLHHTQRWPLASNVLHRKHLHQVGSRFDVRSDNMQRKPGHFLILMPTFWFCYDFRYLGVGTTCLVAVIVPFRDRESHLRIFLRHIHPILMRQDISYRWFCLVNHF